MPEYSRVIAGGQFLLGFRHVERGAVDLGQRGDQEDQRAHRLDNHKPHVGLLRFDDVNQAHRVRQHDGSHEAEPQRQFVRDHLGRGAQPAQHGVLVVR